jgi:hypothetical protein
VVAEVLWQDRDVAAPAWYRVQIVEAGLHPGRPSLRAVWANPTTRMMQLADVAAVRQTPPLLPLSCLGSDRANFQPSGLRAASDPTDLLPQVEMTAAEADQLIASYLHRERHRVGPLWTTVDAQAAATRDRLLQIVATYGAAGTRTDINVAVAAYATRVSVPDAPPRPAAFLRYRTRPVGGRLARGRPRPPRRQRRPGGGRQRAIAGSPDLRRALRRQRASRNGPARWDPRSPWPRRRSTASTTIGARNASRIASSGRSDSSTRCSAATDERVSGAAAPISQPSRTPSGSSLTVLLTGPGRSRHRHRPARSLRRKGSTMERLVTSIGEVL